MKKLSNEILVLGIQKTNKKELKEELVKNNIALIDSVVRKRIGDNISLYDDFINYGVIVFLESVFEFNPQKGTLFSTFVTTCLNNAIYQKMKQEINYINHLTCSEHNDYLAHGQEDDKSYLKIEDNTDYKITCNNILKEANLTDKELLILEHKFGLNDKIILKHKEIAKRLNISLSHFERSLRNILKKIRKS